MTRRLTLALTAVATLAVAGVLAFNAAGADEDRGSPADVVSTTVTQKPEDVEKYWTKERMRDAKPAEMPTGP
ncbi:hypothetical protein [Spirillospora sp. CA-294931]|uniref:hypothetical protein n=1 Tax=Spirillospora sp. CA-294931 TaxID=3240042 RepID=UPI003D8D3966